MEIYSDGAENSRGYVAILTYGEGTTACQNRCSAWRLRCKLRNPSLAHSLKLIAPLVAVPKTSAPASLQRCSTLCRGKFQRLPNAADEMAMSGRVRATNDGVDEVSLP